MPMILNKGQQVDIVREDGTVVTQLTAGASWGKINRGGQSKAAGFFAKVLGSVGASDVVLEDVDLDLSVLAFDANKQLVDKCYFGNKRIFGDAIRHSGDDLVGSDVADGDNERIKVKGLGLPNNVTTLFVVINSFKHQNFEEIPYIGVAIYDGLYELGQKAPRLMEFVIHNDKSFAGAEAAIMARIDKTPKGFVLSAVGTPTRDRSISELVRSCQSIL